MNWNLGTVNIKLNEGCTNSRSCRWCSVQRLEPRVVRGDYDLIFDFIEEMSGKGHRRFRFWSSCFFIDRETRRELLDRFAACHAKLGVSFEAAEGTEPWLLDRETLERMKTAGFQGVSIALETSSEKYRDAWNKPSKAAATIRSIQTAQEVGLDVRVFVMAGVPGQPPEDFRNTLELCRSLDVRFRPNLYGPVPGNELWQEEYGENWPHPLLTNGYSWPGVADIEEVWEYEGVFEEYADKDWTNLRGSGGEGALPPDEADYLEALDWPDGVELRY